MKYIFAPLYRIWFYLLVLVSILILFPIIFVLILSEKTYPLFFKVARFWSWFVLFFMGFRVKCLQKVKLEKNQSYMFVTNHTSMTDIMLMLLAVEDHPFVFVGKKELVKIPVFGFIFKRVCIMVDRSSSKSRFEVFERAQKRLQQGLSICIFPEGGVPHEDIILDEFKDGAFRIAIDHQIPIAAMSFINNKKRFSWSFFSGSPGLMSYTMHPLIPTKGLTQNDKTQLKEQTKALILKDLIY